MNMDISYSINTKSIIHQDQCKHDSLT